MALTWIDDADIQAGVLGCTYLIGNDYEIAQLERRLKISAAQLVQKGIKIITTLGEKGAIYSSAEGSYTVPAYRLEKVVDPTGAGDAFRGGCFGALVEGNSIEDSIRIGNALASYAVGHYGTVNHSPSRDEILSRAASLK